MRFRFDKLEVRVRNLQASTIILKMLFCFLFFLRRLGIAFTGAGAAPETEEEEGLGFTCTSEESESDDLGFICAVLRFVPRVDTSAEYPKKKFLNRFRTGHES